MTRFDPTPLPRCALGARASPTNAAVLAIAIVAAGLVSAAAALAASGPVTCRVADLSQPPAWTAFSSNVDQVLLEHGLPIQLFLKDKGSNLWAFSVRPRSSAEFDLAVLQLDP